MQTHISDSCGYITITHGSCFESEWARDSKDRLLYSQRYKYTLIMLGFETELQCRILAQRQTDYIQLSVCTYKKTHTLLCLSQRGPEIVHSV